jgi:ribosome-binding protein aMBF1 (putative translation factor)
LTKEVRRQLTLSQEGLARKLGINFATVNRWENAQVKPSKSGKAQLDNFCIKMIRQWKLKLPGRPGRNARAGARTRDSK